MIFQGALPKGALLFCKQFRLSKYAIGCVGSFSIPMMMKGDFLANDVSLFSLALSYHLNGIIGDFIYKLDFEREKIQSLLKTEKQFAVICVLAEYGNYFYEKNLYQSRMKKYFESHFFEMVDSFHEKKSVFGNLKHQYFNCDVFDFVKKIDSSVPVFVFPPTYKGGYEKQFRFLDDSFEYERCSFKTIGDEEYKELFDLVRERKNYVFFADREMDGLKVGYVELAGKKTISIYSDMHPDSLGTWQVRDSKPPSLLPIEEDFEFDDNTKISIEEVSVLEARCVMDKYLSSKILKYSTANFYFLLLANGKYFGMLGFSRSGHVPDAVLLMNDLVTNSKEKRLSKLAIMLSKITELKKRLEMLYLREFSKIFTAVYTDKPVSMKYRGIFELERREKGELVYHSEFENRGMREVYLEWLKKYGRKDQ